MVQRKKLIKSSNDHLFSTSAGVFLAVKKIQIERLIPTDKARACAARWLAIQIQMYIAH